MLIGCLALTLYQMLSAPTATGTGRAGRRRPHAGRRRPPAIHGDQCERGAEADERGDHPGDQRLKRPPGPGYGRGVGCGARCGRGGVGAGPAVGVGRHRHGCGPAVRAGAPRSMKRTFRIRNDTPRGGDNGSHGTDQNFDAGPAGRRANPGSARGSRNQPLRTRAGCEPGQGDALRGGVRNAQPDSGDALRDRRAARRSARGAAGPSVPVASHDRARHGRHGGAAEVFTDREATTELYRLTIQPGPTQTSPAHPQGVVEYLTVFSGTALVGPAGAPLTVREGRHVRFPSDVPHIYAALDGEAPGLAGHPPSDPPGRRGREPARE